MSRLRWIDASVDHETAVAVANQVLQARCAWTNADRWTTLAEIFLDVSARRIPADWIDSDAVSAAVHDEGDGSTFLVL
jgi:hypothetical protein